MTITQCPICDGKVSARVEACPHCGCPVGPQITCPDCGENFAASLTACPECGGPVEAPEDPQELPEPPTLAASPKAKDERVHLKEEQPPQSDPGGRKSASLQVSARLGVFGTLARGAAGLLGFICLTTYDAIWNEVQAPNAASPGWVIATGYGLYLVSAALVFLVFFRAKATRVVLSAEGAVAKHKKAIAGLIVTCGGVGLVGSIAYLVLLDATLPVTRGVLTDFLPLGSTAWLILLSVGALALGWGLWVENRVARKSLVAAGFLFYGGFPIGTALAMYIWWFAMSPVVRAAYEERHVSETEESADEPEPITPETVSAPSTEPEPVATKDERFNLFVAIAVGALVFQIARSLGVINNFSIPVYLAYGELAGLLVMSLIVCALFGGPVFLLAKYGKKQPSQAYAGILAVLFVVFVMAILAEASRVELRL